jgi:hypothetical protein
MPSLSESIGQDLSGYGPVDPSSGPQVAASLPSQMPSYTGLTRSPLPILSQQNDVTRLFYAGTGVMQTRTFNLQAPGVVDLTSTNKAIATAQSMAKNATNTATAAARTANGSAMTTATNSNGTFVKTGSFIQQFGTVSITSTSSPTTVTFPVPFVTSNINVQVTASSTSSAGFVNVVEGSISTSGFSAVTGLAPQVMTWSAQGF